MSGLRLFVTHIVLVCFTFILLNQPLKSTLFSAFDILAEQKREDLSDKRPHKQVLR